jgi:choline dehydrogenase-like flavoprotein
MSGTTDCDAVIIGTGPAGATAAEVLTDAGWSVVMLEKGSNHLLALNEPFGPLGQVSNDELKFQFRHFLGPDPLLEPRTYRRREADGDRIWTGAVNNLPSTVGGGGFHADGKLPRFREVDFRMRS